MRQLVTVLACFALLSFAFTTSPVAAASPTSQTIAITGTLQYGSILGGTTNGTATLSGDVSTGDLSALRGAVNLPLKDEKITVTPTGSITLAAQDMNVFWQRYTCGPFGCTFESGLSTFERQYGQGPVDIRFGSMRGDGTLTLATDSTCVAACPPPGAYWYAPTGTTQLNGAVVGSQDAGNLNLYGPAPVIR